MVLLLSYFLCFCWDVHFCWDGQPYINVIAFLVSSFLFIMCLRVLGYSAVLIYLELAMAIYSPLSSGLWLRIMSLGTRHVIADSFHEHGFQNRSCSIRHRSSYSLSRVGTLAIQADVMSMAECVGYVPYECSHRVSHNPCQTMGALTGTVATLLLQSDCCHCHFLWCLLVCVCVCGMCIWYCLCVCGSCMWISRYTYLCMSMQGPRQNVFLSLCLIALRQGHSLNQKFPTLTSLACQWTLRICLSPHPNTGILAMSGLFHGC